MILVILNVIHFLLHPPFVKSTLIDHAACTQDGCKHSSLSPTLNVSPDSQACALCRQVVKAPHLCPQVPKPAHHYMSLVILNTPAGTSQ